VDDHALVRTGIRRVLEETPDWTVCAEAEDGKEAVQKAVDLKPNLILMDVSMPIMNGIEATKQIRRLSPGMKIVILSMHNAPQLAQQARESGANAYVVKASSVDRLRKTIGEVLSADPQHFTEA
jgi:DNA-binding NarL/FixJ family response regulator